VLYCFSLHTYKLEKIETLGEKPSPRYQHGSFVTQDDLYITGGILNPTTESLVDLYKFNFESAEWTKIHLSGNAPLWKFGMSCCWDKSSQFVFLVGGQFTALNSVSSEVHCFSLSSKSWCSMPISESHPGSGPFHASVEYDGNIFVFGGVHHNTQNKMFMLQMKKSPESLLILAAKVCLAQFGDISVLEGVLSAEALKKISQTNGGKKPVIHEGSSAIYSHW